MSDLQTPWQQDKLLKSFIRGSDGELLFCIEFPRGPKTDEQREMEDKIVALILEASENH